MLVYQNRMQKGKNMDGVMPHWPPALESHALSVHVQLAASALAQQIQNRGLERKTEAQMRGEEEGQTV